MDQPTNAIGKLWMIVSDLHYNYQSESLTNNCSGSFGSNHWWFGNQGWETTIICESCGKNYFGWGVHLYSTVDLLMDYNFCQRCMMSYQAEIQLEELNLGNWQRMRN
jgi:hypothetical protein